MRLANGMVLPLGWYCHLDATWMPLGCHLDATWMPLGCHLDADRCLAGNV